MKINIVYRSFLYAFNALVPYGLHASDTLLKSHWQSDFGHISLHVSKDGIITGNYPDYNGQLHGHVMEDGRLEVYWIQPASKQRCVSDYQGQFYWGTVNWSLIEKEYLQGYWTYCGDSSTGGSWNAHPYSIAETLKMIAGTAISVAGQIAGATAGGGNVVGSQLTRIAISHGSHAMQSAIQHKTVIKETISGNKADTILIMRNLSTETDMSSICSNRNSPNPRKRKAAYMAQESGYCS